jgi:hypothetical protein
LIVKTTTFDGSGNKGTVVIGAAGSYDDSAIDSAAAGSWIYQGAESQVRSTAGAKVKITFNGGPAFFLVSGDVLDTPVLLLKSGLLTTTDNNSIVTLNGDATLNADFTIKSATITGTLTVADTAEIIAENAAASELIVSAGSSVIYDDALLLIQRDALATEGTYMWDVDAWKIPVVSP